MTKNRLMENTIMENTMTQNAGPAQAGSSNKMVVSNLTKRFGNLEVLSEINTDIGNGEFISFIGPSGCGKTTFLRIIAGLDQASSGEVRLNGRAVRAPGADRGFVFQNDNLLPWRTVFDNAFLGLEIAGRVGDAERRRTLDLLKLVGLAGFEDYYPRQLSGGMRQRLNLARALAVDPEVLLMDEPFSALDAQTREIMQTELMRVWEQGRKTVLFVTHQIDEAVFLSDRIFVFARRPGRIQEVVHIDLPRPRPLDIKRTPKFVAYVDHIWRLIEHDVRESVLHENA
jgi:NitT/TauT family transport system ATP-binding protein